MALDPLSIVMLAVVALLIFFMFRNGKKRQQAMQELQNGLRPGAEVMLQSGIYGTIESLDDENNRATLRSGTTTLEVHRNAITQIVTPVEADLDSEPTAAEFAPDDDPAFGERVSKGSADEAALENEAPLDRPEDDDRTEGDTPKA